MKYLNIMGTTACAKWNSNYHWDIWIQHGKNKTKQKQTITIKNKTKQKTKTFQQVQTSIALVQKLSTWLKELWENHFEKQTNKQTSAYVKTFTSEQYGIKYKELWENHYEKKKQTNKRNKNKQKTNKYQPM